MSFLTLRRAAFVSLPLLVLSLPVAAVTTIGATIKFEDRGTAASPASDLFTVRQDSDAGWIITALTIDISTADENQDLFLIPGPHVPVFDTLDGCSPDYCYGAEIGYPVSGLNGGVVGFINPTPAEQAAWEEGQSVSLNFDASDLGNGTFDPGDFFFFTTDLDDRVDFRVSGIEFARSTYSITFHSILGTHGDITLSGVFGSETGTTSIWDAIGQVSATVPPVPVPPALWLFAAALSALLVLRR